MSCFKIIESPHSRRKQKKPDLNKIKTFLNFLPISDLDGHDRKKSTAVEIIRLVTYCA